MPRRRRTSRRRCRAGSTLARDSSPRHAQRRDRMPERRGSGADASTVCALSAKLASVPMPVGRHGSSHMFRGSQLRGGGRLLSRPGQLPHLTEPISECGRSSPPDIRHPADVGLIQAVLAAGRADQAPPGRRLSGWPANRLRSLSGEPGSDVPACAGGPAGLLTLIPESRSARWRMSAGPLRSHADTSITGRSRQPPRRRESPCEEGPHQ